MSKRAEVAPRKQPTQERSRATVDAILQATAYILVREGYAKLTTNRVAERAGVNIASLYQYFPGKEALVAELQRRHVEEARGEAREALRAHRGKSLQATIRAMVNAGIAAHAVDPGLHRVFEEEMPRLRPRRPGAPSDEPFLDERRELVTAAQIPADRLEIVTWLVRTVTHAAVHRAAQDRPDDLRSGALAHELNLLLERYLQPKRARAKRPPSPGAR